MSWLRWLGVIALGAAMLGPLIYLMYESWVRSGKK